MLRRTHPEGFQRCSRHSHSWHKPSAGCDICRHQALAEKRADAIRARSAKALADQAIALAADSIPLALEAACEMNTLAADIETAERVRRYVDTHQRVEQAFFAALEPQR